MFRFESPQYLIWISAVLIFVGVYFWTEKKAARNLAKAFGARVSPFLSASVSTKKRRMKLALLMFIWVLLVLALARPQSGHSTTEIRSEGVEIIFAVDVSESMMAEDVRPSRLGQMKSELSRLVDLMGGHKIGLVGFAGSAALLSPLTTDPAALKMYIDSLSPYSVSSQGTNFQAALEESDAAFKRGGVEDDQSTRVTRVVLVLSDGEDHEPGALEVAKKLTTEGVRIFTIAYGTERGGVIPERDSLGFLKGNKKDRNGQVVMTTVKGEALGALASAGKGELFFASPGGNHLERFLAALDRLEKTQFESQMATEFDEKYSVLLWMVLTLAFLEVWVGERKTPFRLWRGRFEVPPA